MKAVWEGQTVSRSEIPSGAEQFFTWTVAAIKEDKSIIVINNHLRSINRRLRIQVGDLELYLKLS